MATAVQENEYKFTVKTGRAGQITITNSTTRDWLYRELVVVADGNDLHFIGFVAEPGGIAAAASGQIDMFPEQEVTTSQYTAGAFTEGDVNVYVTPQTNSAAALITVASASGDVPLAARIEEYDNTNGFIRLRMPVQNGTAAAAA